MYCALLFEGLVEIKWKLPHPWPYTIGVGSLNAENSIRVEGWVHVFLFLRFNEFQELFIFIF